MKTAMAIGAVIVAVALVVSLAPLLTVPHEVAVDYRDTETYYEDEPLRYRDLGSGSRFVESKYFSEVPKGQLGDLENWAAAYGYEIKLSGGLLLTLDHWALYVIIQNLDDIGGEFEVGYTLATADKQAAERQKDLSQRTSQEWNELAREYYEGDIHLHLEPQGIGVFICPPEGIYISSDRVPFEHDHQITPPTRQVERERPATRQRQETRYKKVTLLDYLLHYWER